MNGFVSEGIENFVKNGVRSVISVFVIAFSLFLLGLFLLISGNIKAGIEGLKKTIPIFVFFGEDTGIGSIMDTKLHLEGDPIVNSVEYVSSTEALKEFFQDIKGSLDNVFEDGKNPFPPFLEVYPKKEFVLNREKISSFREDLKNNPYIENVEYDNEWGIRIEALVKVWDYLIYFVGFIFFVTIAFIISNTVDLSIQNQRREMDVIRWVGGSSWIIVGQFLVEGVIQAAFGGVLSLVMLYVSFNVFRNISFAFIKTLLPNSSLVFLPPIVMFKIMLVAVTVGGLGSFVSVSRLINMRKMEAYR